MRKAVPFPSYAYIPGQTARHPSNAFDKLKGDIKAPFCANDIMQSDAWAAGLQYLAGGYFWEAHEVLEAVWLRTNPNSPEKHFVQALIQLANAGLKLRMGQPKASTRILRRVRHHIDECRVSKREHILGLKLSTVEGWLPMIRAGEVITINKHYIA